MLSAANPGVRDIKSRSFIASCIFWMFSAISSLNFKQSWNQVKHTELTIVYKLVKSWEHCINRSNVSCDLCELSPICHLESCVPPKALRNPLKLSPVCHSENLLLPNVLCKLFDCHQFSLESYLPLNVSCNPLKLSPICSLKSHLPLNVLSNPLKLSRFCHLESCLSLSCLFPNRNFKCEEFQGTLYRIKFIDETLRSVSKVL